MMPHKTRLEFLLFLVLVFSGALLRHPVLLALAIPVGWHLVLSAAFSTQRALENLAATRRIVPARLQEGESLTVQVEVKNAGSQTVEVYVRDEVPVGLTVLEGKWFAAAVLSPEETLTLSYRARPSRGVYRFSTVQVEVRKPLDLAPIQGELPCFGQVWVLPRIEQGLSLAAGARRALPIPGTSRSRRGGLGLEFYGVREWRPGDAPRKLAWKAMARRDEPVVVEFEEERATEIALILDTRRRAYRESPALFEHAVRAAASLANHFLRQGHRVGLLQYGTILDWVFPGYGRRHAERILRELSRAQLGDSQVFAELAHLPTRLFPAGSLLVIVSPLVLGDEETLGRLVARGYRVWVIMPMGGEEAKEPRREADLACRIRDLERLVFERRVRRTGAVVLPWPVERPLGAVLRRARRALCRSSL